MTYAVNDLYHAIQGEGGLAGTPMLLLRLHGCAVGCPWCDTKETWTPDPAQRVATLAEATRTPGAWVQMIDHEIVREIEALTVAEQWVMLTGGEPAEQPINPLIRQIREAGYRVNLETSGTADGHLGDKAGIPDWITVSPKLNMPGAKELLPAVLDTAHEIKMVVGRERDLEALTSLLAVLKKPPLRVSVQPVAGSERAIRLCTEACRLHGWNLSLQQHKLINLR